MSSVTAIITRPAPVSLPPATVTLTMDEETAATLRSLVGSIWGDTPQRKQMDKVWDALTSVGVKSDYPGPFSVTANKK